jgi:predicted DNA-binding protein
MKSMHVKSDEVLRLRAPLAIKNRLQRVAARRNVRMAHIMREAIVRHIEEEEGRLGIAPAK